MTLASGSGFGCGGGTAARQGHSSLAGSFAPCDGIAELLWAYRGAFPALTPTDVCHYLDSWHRLA
jgi:hypothetical protein